MNVADFNFAQLILLKKDLFSVNNVEHLNMVLEKPTA